MVVEECVVGIRLINLARYGILKARYVILQGSRFASPGIRAPEKRVLEYRRGFHPSIGPFHPPFVPLSYLFDNTWYNVLTSPPQFRCKRLMFKRQERSRYSNKTSRVRLKSESGNAVGS